MGSGLAVSVFLAAAMSAASLPPPAAASAFSSFTVGDLAAAGRDPVFLDRGEFGPPAQQPAYSPSTTTTINDLGPVVGPHLVNARAFPGLEGLLRVWILDCVLGHKTGLISPHLCQYNGAASRNRFPATSGAPLPPAAAAAPGPEPSATLADGDYLGFLVQEMVGAGVAADEIGRSRVGGDPEGPRSRLFESLRGQQASQREPHSKKDHLKVLRL